MMFTGKCSFAIICMSICVLASASNANNALEEQREKSNHEGDSNITAATAITEGDNKFAVFGYLPEWRYEGANYNILCEHLTHLLLFSLEIKIDGRIGALDRIPSTPMMQDIQDAASQSGSSSEKKERAKTKIMICFGGNGRSNGFASMVRTKKKRAVFLKALIRLCKKYKFSGVDYNWEYPGYTLGKGYENEKKIHADYQGLSHLVTETREAFQNYTKSNNNDNTLEEDVVLLDTITIAYYPDSKQEALLVKYGIADAVDYMHSMSYDQTKNHHSSLEYGKQTAQQAKQIVGKKLINKVTLGVPFYGRHVQGNEWVTYEDIVQKYQSLLQHDDGVDQVFDNEKGKMLAFNGRDTIQEKVNYAKQLGLGGVMIWEAGQDCRIQAVTRNGQTHVVTCPNGKESSLLVAITKALQGDDKDDFTAKKQTEPSKKEQAKQEL